MDGMTAVTVGDEHLEFSAPPKPTSWSVKHSRLVFHIQRASNYSRKNRRMPILCSRARTFHQSILFPRILYTLVHASVAFLSWCFIIAILERSSFI